MCSKIRGKYLEINRPKTMTNNLHTPLKACKLKSLLSKSFVFKILNAVILIFFNRSIFNLTLILLKRITACYR